MYEMVKTARQQQKFARTWEYFCDLYGWYNDPYADNGVRYNLLKSKKSKKVIGTIEFIPYNPSNPDSTVKGRIEPSEVEEIFLYQNRVWEIDKLCLHQDYQRKGYFENFFHIFYQHAKVHQPKYYIGFMEYRFFRMLRIFFGLAVEQRGDAVLGPTTTLLPVLFDVEKIMNDQECVRRLLNATNTPQTVLSRFIHNRFFKQLLSR